MTGKCIPSWFLVLRPIVPVLIATLSGAAAIAPSMARGGEEVLASVGTGELNRVYYPVSKAICETKRFFVECSRPGNPGASCTSPRMHTLGNRKSTLSNITTTMSAEQ